MYLFELALANPLLPHHPTARTRRLKVAVSYLSHKRLARMSIPNVNPLRLTIVFLRKGQLVGAVTGWDIASFAAHFVADLFTDGGVLLKNLRPQQPDLLR